MSLLRNITRGLRSLLRKEQVERELDQELRAYQEMVVEEKIKNGMSRKEALRAGACKCMTMTRMPRSVRSAAWLAGLVHAEGSWHE